MSSFEKIIRVTPNDLDELDHVNNIRYLEWVQDISKAHWEYTAGEILQKEWVWVVRNHSITYHDSALLNEEIAIHTRVLKWKGPLSIRFVEMLNNKTGQLLVNATTTWCLIDTKTRKPARVPEHIRKLFH